ncbi:hypothetical protein [Paenibacillus elgii]
MPRRTRLGPTLPGKAPLYFAELTPLTNSNVVFVKVEEHVE